MFHQDGLAIILGSNPSLKQKAKEVKDPKKPKIKTIIKQMKKTLNLNNGVGLAAPQIGKNLQIIVIKLNYELYTIINPTVIDLSSSKTKSQEGCLSFPGIFKPIERSNKVIIKYLDEKGEKQTLQAKDLLARAIQHEIDHLEGILFIDRYEESEDSSTPNQASINSNPMESNQPQMNPNQMNHWQETDGADFDLDKDAYNNYPVNNQDSQTFSLKVETEEDKLEKEENKPKPNPNGQDQSDQKNRPIKIPIQSLDEEE
jgi:peptide deformylase